MPIPQMMMVHSDRHPSAVRSDLEAHFGFVPDHVFTVAGDRPVDPKGTQRFVTREFIQQYCAGRKVLIHNTDVPDDVRDMTPMQQLVLTHSSWGYRNIPTELKQLDFMEAIEIGTRDPAIGTVHYLVTRKPSEAESA